MLNVEELPEPGTRVTGGTFTESQTVTLIVQ
jgi:hypothetical protein